jgi:hypothetical protein
MIRVTDEMPDQCRSDEARSTRDQNLHARIRCSYPRS